MSVRGRGGDDVPVLVNDGGSGDDDSPSDDDDSGDEEGGFIRADFLFQQAMPSVVNGRDCDDIPDLVSDSGSDVGDDPGIVMPLDEED